jgi:hypothetical protein
LFIVNSNADFYDLKFKIIKVCDKSLEPDIKEYNCKNYLSKSEFVDLVLNYSIENYHAILAYMFLSEDVGTLEALEKCLIFA